MLRQRTNRIPSCCNLGEYVTIAILLFASCVIFIGCNQGAATTATTAKPTDNWPTLVSELTEQHAAIRDGMASDDHDNVHGALHSVTSTLQKLVLIDSKSGLAAEELTEVKSAAERMAELYGKIDAGHHGGEEASYDDFSDELQQLMDKISSIKK